MYAILVTLVTFFRGGRQGPGHLCLLFILVSFILVFHLFHFKPSPTLNLYMRVQLKYNFELFITNWEKIVHIGFYLWDFNIMHWKWPPMCTLIIFSLKVKVLNKTNNIVHINHSSPVTILILISASHFEVYQHEKLLCANSKTLNYGWRPPLV